jgi:murein L,D-transpeptidase YcbB/YkuD
MAGYIRQAVVNPYWNVPENLVRKTIAAGVLGQGQRYLRVRGYEVLSDWSDEPEQLDPAAIDWRAVSRGDLEVRVRQKPNDLNAMGSVKFEFPNPMGIYLHDTPDKKLLLEEARQFSNGCVRLEDYRRFASWVFPRAPQPTSAPEQIIPLPRPVPIYMTYLTVETRGNSVYFRPDPYRFDDLAVPQMFGRSSQA